MAFGFRLLPVGLEEAMFKKIPEGWLFTTLGPWLFAPRRTYVVSDAQKPAIARRVRRGRYIRLFLMLLQMPLMVVAVLKYPSLLKTHALQAWLVLGSMCLAFGAVICVSDYLNIRPLLRGVPRTTQKIRAIDMLRTQSRTMSTRALAIFTAVFTLGALADMFIALTGGDAFVGLTAGIQVAFALVFGGMLVAKIRAKPVGNIDA